MTQAPPRIRHVPHAGRLVPVDVRAPFLVDRAALARERQCMTDHYADVLFASGDPERDIVFPVSPLVIDAIGPEDGHGDAGAGVIPTRAQDGRPLRQPPTDATREFLLARYYRPHHERLTGLIERDLGRYGQALLLNGHSFASQPFPGETDPRPHRPEICIGTDAFHTPEVLRDKAVRAFLEQGFVIALDRPLAGTFVPFRYRQRDRRVAALTIGVRRDLYMDETTGRQRVDFDAFLARLAAILGRL
ncbi:MAG: N-formylglutamate amidohydrolase [Candidatus Competibacterales bacterium]|nr:N-formylglutamate amidohydrolase [Candidatus Competibacterales bacterium]